ncbi:serine hydroxymethyltransferase [Dehalococcoidia bacterium]|nr:serine hydroxymethyltransferase [Dehalococcoidia bacterium]MCL0048812.1 serine hydroxymethyltransferase [Dehalococcoidia bacterium]
MSLARIDPQIAGIILDEERRQCSSINLIASENYASLAVLEAQGSVLTNKYAEGYPGRRYYGGCRNADQAEEIALHRAKDLFGAEYANVQAYSGSIANMAAYMTLINYGDTILSMALDQGGHLTHGSPISFSGKLYRPVFYGLDRETGQIDYDEVERMAVKNMPRLIVVGSSSYPRILDYKRFRQIADRVNAGLLVDMAHEAGLIAAGVHPSPIPYADVATATTHKSLRGPRGGLILCRAKFGASIDRSVFPGLQGGPMMHIIAAKAVAFHEAKQPHFIAYQQAVVENARILADRLLAEGMHLVTGGTDNHRVLVDLTPTGITGKTAESALSQANIVVNKNAIPFDPRPPDLTSGIRLGTPALTSRGFGTEEMARIAQLIVRVLSHIGDEKLYREVRLEVEEMNRRFPTPGINQLEE